MRFQELTSRLNETKGRLSKADAMLILREIETGKGGICWPSQFGIGRAMVSSSTR